LSNVNPKAHAQPLDNEFDAEAWAAWGRRAKAKTAHMSGDSTGAPGPESARGLKAELRRFVATVRKDCGADGRSCALVENRTGASEGAAFGVNKTSVVASLGSSSSCEEIENVSTAVLEFVPSNAARSF
jgi:hypothetical protein